MRDPDRIPEICQLLEKEWAKKPNMRLGQFLINFVFFVPCQHDLPMWNQSDKSTKTKLKKWEENIAKIAKEQSRITDSFGTSGE